jgi:hypothetical protein
MGRYDRARDRSRREERRRSFREEGIRVGPSGDPLDWDGTIRSRRMRFRVYGLQVLATVFLFLLFILNWSMNPWSFDVRYHSDFLGNASFLSVGIIGLVVGAITCVLPSVIAIIVRYWRRVFGFEYTVFRGILVLMAMIILIAIIAGPSRVAYLLLQGFIAFFYMAAIIFGVYGIWNLKGTHLITAGMFSFFTTISRPKPSSDLDSVLLFAISFLLFMELSSSAIRHHLLASEELVPVKYQARMVDRYILYLCLFASLALGLTYIAMNTRGVVNLISPAWAVEAIEVQGYLGVILPALASIMIVWVFRSTYDRFKGGRPLPTADEEGEKDKRGYLQRFFISRRMEG